MRYLLITPSRSGTSYFCGHLMAYFTKIDQKYQIINQELLNKSYYDIPDNRLRHHLTAYFQKYGCRFDTATDDVIYQICIDILTNKKHYIFKYDTDHYTKIIDSDIMIQLVKSLKMQIIFLYRQSIRDKAISHMMQDSGYKINAITEETIHRAVDLTVRGYTDFIDGYKLFGGVHHTIFTYEDFRFDGNDLNRTLGLADGYDIPITTTQAIVKDLKLEVIKQFSNMILPALRQQFDRKNIQYTLDGDDMRFDIGVI